MEDALDSWLSIRDAVDWSEFDHVEGPVAGLRDGHRHFIETVVRPRDAHRADALVVALGQARFDATKKAPIDFERLCEWQRIVLDVPSVAFRAHPAFAKGGRERYGFDDGTILCFERCLGEADSSQLSVLGRSARVYFDILFFHPFVDGNGRAAALVLDYMLAREDICLDEVRPLFMVSRSPDLAGARAFLRLLGSLTESTRLRKAHKV